MSAAQLLQALPPDDVAALRAAAVCKTFQAGEEIFREGTPGDGVYGLKSGLVQISTALANGERSVFATIEPGEIFGEMAVLDEKPRSATATAETASEVYFVPRPALLALLQRSPSLSMVLLREISGRLREFNHQYIDKIVQSERLAVIGRLASSIIHDLKTPLTVISLSTQLAASDNAAPETRERSKAQVLRQVDQINQMVGDVLEFARGGVAKHPLEQVNYSSFVRTMIEDLQKEGERRKFRLGLGGMPPSVPVKLNAARLSRVFWNLVRNAADVTQPGGSISLRFQLTPEAVVTEVADTGPGIAPEILNSLFEAFKTFGKEDGTGLGLSIAKKIIEEHGGEISAENQASGGAVFRFTLPRLPA